MVSESVQNLQYLEPSGLKTCSHLAKMFPELQFGISDIILALESTLNLKQLLMQKVKSKNMDKLPNMCEVVL